ncbi:hypothetical protein A3J78_00690 [Candidatus Beckwithbacteria bacterium RBG_13_35_6]|uniref:Uncharacterized protein n=1 Tax=Candidatus Beckwithbacteria bacterium RBG_13_35_6 TaxID=1797456 RepID=A0A1F5DF98_9BACT|nr:MAG: hypothetical protein A3J78_00690 [Candidatus Beckwithbacteria bacterium RBG_13_35_6]
MSGAVSQAEKQEGLSDILDPNAFLELTSEQTAIQRAAVKRYINFVTPSLEFLRVEPLAAVVGCLNHRLLSTE